ncbi:hypothetical protein RhiirA4_472053 [Rhizophagus irregularis]|uniref:Uncharacterized protein n=1 Tax=Rhizophagus irregularis TaxID=588596 RepID=A0A2I1H491_9GLOM|nr:hypothetical protein RhiirA4_472053 [Rhizophagus irregularis]
MKIYILICIIVTYLSLVSAADSIGGKWGVNANGHNALLVIEDRNGILNGTYIYEDAKNDIIGTYSSSSGVISFIRINGDRPSTYQFYTGYLFRDNTPNQYMAGSFTALPPSGGEVNRPLFGWFAKKTSK